MKKNKCSFCGRDGDDVRLIQGQDCFICETCIEVCYRMLGLDKKKTMMTI